MARPSDLQTIVQAFTTQIVAAVETATAERIRGALAQAMGAPVKRGPGRPRMSAAPMVGARAARATLKRKARTSAKQTRARKIQGQYLGTMRTLSAEARNRVKAVAKEKGVAEALKLALSLKK